MVRAGNYNELAEDVEQKGAVAIGWPDMGDLSSYSSREEVKEKYRVVYPEHNENRVSINSGQIYRFICEIEKEDIILTYIKATRKVLIGNCSSDYIFDPEIFDANLYSEAYPHIRRVQWQKKVSRDIFSVPARNSMGCFLTVFSLEEHLREIRAVLADETLEPKEGELATVRLIYQDVREKANELIADKLSKLDPYDFQELVAGLLQAIGYKTKVSAPGPDKGVDIVAHPDALGFESPRIKVQVKHRAVSIGAPEVRNFIGTLRDNDKGLFVSTGGYSREVMNDPNISSRPITLLDRDQFIDLLLEHYEKLAPEHKSIIPLKKVYLPIE